MLTTETLLVSQRATALKVFACITRQCPLSCRVVICPQEWLNPPLGYIYHRRRSMRGSEVISGRPVLAGGEIVALNTALMFGKSSKKCHTILLFGFFGFLFTKLSV